MIILEIEHTLFVKLHAMFTLKSTYIGPTRQFSYDRIQQHKSINSKLTA